MKAAAIVIYASDLDKPGFAAVARATGPSATPMGKADEPDNAGAVVRRHGLALVTVRTAGQESASGLVSWPGVYLLSVTAAVPEVLAVSGSGKPVAYQRAGFAVSADYRDSTAWLVEQVADLAEIADAVLAQQPVHVRVR